MESGVLGGIDRSQSSPATAGCKSPGIAVSQNSHAVADQRQPVPSDGVAHGNVLIQNLQRLVQKHAQQLRDGIRTILPDPAAAAVQSPCEIDRRRTR